MSKFFCEKCCDTGYKPMPHSDESTTTCNCAMGKLLDEQHRTANVQIKTKSYLIDYGNI